MFVAALGWAQTADYFPLEVGNQWIYRSSGFGGVTTVSMEVTGRRTMAAQDYFVVKDFREREVLVRQSEDGTLLILQDGGEGVWVPFGASDGDAFRSVVDACSTDGKLMSHAASYAGPIGGFGDAVEVRYSGRCADAGLVRELFLPWVGLVRREETTIGGTRAYDLIYASLGGVTYVSEPHVSFTLTLDRSAYGSNLPSVIPQMTARLTLRNTQDRPWRLSFPTTQDFDLVLRNAQGDEVYRWSKGKAFGQVFRDVPISGEKNWTVVVPLADAGGRLFAPGRYTAEASLATSPAGQFTSRVFFEILALP